MSREWDAIEAIKDALNTEYNRISFENVSLKDIDDVQIPLLIIAAIDSEYNNDQSFKLYSKSLNIQLIQYLSKTSDPPLKTILDKEQIIAEKIFSSDVLKCFAHNIDFRGSTATNLVLDNGRNNILMSKLQIQLLIPF